MTATGAIVITHNLSAFFIEAWKDVIRFSQYLKAFAP